ncbi:CZB domain-containing protein [Halothiobacillus sp. DCM-1]|uniref:CZB domain-containing protein n=1 Tax=Halothiobacillus sp. DCM-1 TaxID=3112558 RepID=UPI00324BA701
MSSNAAADFDYEHFINAFEEVTYWHFAWYSQIMAALLFGRIKHIQGHHECKFGQFLDQNLIPPTETAEFAAVRNLHQQMHEAASALMASQDDTGTVEEELFEEFSELQSLFAAACNALLRAAITRYAQITTEH